MLREVKPGINHLVAYVTCKTGTEVRPDELKGFAQQMLPSYMIPSAIVVLDKFPMTANGKIDRKAFPTPEFTADKKTAYVPADSELEQKLVAVWEEVLGVHPIGINDDFFILGGNSLLATRLSARIREMIDDRITSSALYHSLTVKALARLMREDRMPSENSSVVCIQHGVDNVPPLFIIHMVGTGLKFCLPMVKHLGPDQPVYALSIHLFDWLPGKEQTVEDFARRYIEEVRSIRPEGPYLLLGISFGGIVAFEMARRMYEENDDVRLVALMDSSIGNAYRKLDAADRLNEHRQKLKQEGVSYLVRKVRERLIHQWERFYETFRDLYSVNMLEYYKATGKTAFMPIGVKEYAARLDNDLAARSYKPGSYNGKLTLFRSTERAGGTSEILDPLLGWGVFANGGIEVVDCPSDHLGMLGEPHVQIVAQNLKACIAKSLNTEPE
jgi:aspartate racemase